MISPLVVPVTAPARTASVTSVLMCAPTHFSVQYAINPWMDPSIPTDVDRALAQWAELKATYASLGWNVHVIDGVEGLPDMVYAANGALVVDGVAYTASFLYPERQGEASAYAAWLKGAGYRVVHSTAVNEGEGDFLLVGDAILAGTGFRSALASHDEAREVFGREVVTLTLVRPEFYHLDTALAVLDARPGQEQIAYLPSAFDAASLAILEARYPDAIIVDEADAAVLGLNVVSDGLNVVLPALATGFAKQLTERGFRPVGVDLSELLKGGGAVKCCTLALRAGEGR